jgi:beta-N-acetylhexosaminidase
VTRSDVARLLWIALDGPSIGPDEDALLRAGVGGVVLFGRNITGVEALRELTADLRRRATQPLRVAIDHEGGHIVRIGAPLTRFPSAMAVAAAGSEALAEACSRAAALELRSIGIDVNLAPVLDVAVDPRNPSVGVRSFGSDPDSVGRYGAASVRGLQAGGVAATAKHFPGHGRTSVDPHQALPRIPGGVDELRRTDLPPFRAAIDAKARVVMVTHASYGGLSDDLPATLSSPVMADLLRGELSFDGLAVTDALNMGAIANGMSVAEAAVRSIIAGADAAMPLDDQPGALRALEAAHADGRLTDDRVADAVRRADALHAALGSTPEPTSLPNYDHAELASEVARRSLTLLSSGELLPLPASTNVGVIEFATRRPSLVEERQPLGEDPSLSGLLTRAGLQARGVLMSGNPDQFSAERAAALQAAGESDVVVVATRDAYLWEEDRTLVEELAVLPISTITVALRNPYDLVALAATTERIAAYSDVPATLAALADALTGRAGFPGRQPMRFDVPAGVA